MSHFYLAFLKESRNDYNHPNLPLLPFYLSYLMPWCWSYKSHGLKKDIIFWQRVKKFKLLCEFPTSPVSFWRTVTDLFENTNNSFMHILTILRKFHRFTSQTKTSNASFVTHIICYSKSRVCSPSDSPIVSLPSSSSSSLHDPSLVDSLDLSPLLVLKRFNSSIKRVLTWGKIKELKREGTKCQKVYRLYS